MGRCLKSALKNAVRHRVVGKIGMSGFGIAPDVGWNLFFGHCTPIVIGAEQLVHRCKRGTEWDKSPGISQSIRKVAFIFLA